MHPESIFFTRRCERVAKSRVYWEVVIPAIVGAVILFTVLSIMFGDGKIYTPGALIVIPLTLIRKQQKNPATVYFRHTHDAEFNFGFIDHFNRTEEYPVSEYTYWCCMGPKPGYIELFLMIGCGDKTFYLKETRIANSAPHGWTINEARTKQQPGFFLVDSLELLAYTLDRGSGNEVTEEIIMQGN